MTAALARRCSRPVQFCHDAQLWPIRGTRQHCPHTPPHPYIELREARYFHRTAPRRSAQRAGPGPPAWRLGRRAPGLPPARRGSRGQAMAQYEGGRSRQTRTGATSRGGRGSSCPPDAGGDVGGPSSRRGAWQPLGRRVVFRLGTTINRLSFVTAVNCKKSICQIEIILIRAQRPGRYLAARCGDRRTLASSSSTAASASSSDPGSPPAAATASSRSRPALAEARIRRR